MDIETRINNLSVRIFQKAAEDHSSNILVSPVAAIAALATMLPGADGNTRVQMEENLGISYDDMQNLLERILRSRKLDEIDDLDTFARMLPSLRIEKSYADLATVLWMNDLSGLSFNDDLIQTLAADENCEVLQTGDLDRACQHINDWCCDKTQEKVPQFVNHISPDEVMRLVNALTFDGKWATPYKDEDVYIRPFTNQHGERQDILFMHSEEDTYLCGFNATGFIKHYSGWKYAFAALLPNEGTTLQELISSLDYLKLSRLLGRTFNGKVLTATPKFTAERDIDLKPIFQNLGVTEAFSKTKADFFRLCRSDDPDCNFYLDHFHQKTLIDVNERGTQAIAMTGLETLCLTSEIEPEPYKVYLDRPFLYMITERHTGIPLFMGTVEEL